MVRLLAVLLWAKLVDSPLHGAVGVHGRNLYVFSRAVFCGVGCVGYSAP